MAENIQNQVAIELNVNATHPNVVADNENARLMGEYMVPLVVESQSALCIRHSVRQIFTWGRIWSIYSRIHYNSLGELLKTPMLIFWYFWTCATIKYSRVQVKQSAQASSFTLWETQLGNGWIPPHSITS